MLVVFVSYTTTGKLNAGRKKNCKYSLTKLKVGTFLIKKTKSLQQVKVVECLMIYNYKTNVVGCLSTLNTFSFVS